MAEVVFVIESIIAACVAISEARNNKEYAKYDKLYRDMNYQYNQNPEYFEKPKVKPLFKDLIDLHYEEIKKPEYLDYYNNSRLSKSVEPTNTIVPQITKPTLYTPNNVYVPQIPNISEYHSIGSAIPNPSHTAINFHNQNMEFLYKFQQNRLKNMWNK